MLCGAVRYCDDRFVYQVPFAFEEAIGFMIGSEIRDKDGIAAMVNGHRFLS